MKKPICKFCGTCECNPAYSVDKCLPCQTYGPPKLTCDECGETKNSEYFCDVTASEPHCKECAEGFWE